MWVFSVRFRSHNVSIVTNTFDNFSSQTNVSLQETDYQQECRTEYSQSCSTVYDTRQGCRTEYDQQCNNVTETNCQDIQVPRRCLRGHPTTRVWLRPAPCPRWAWISPRPDTGAASCSAPGHRWICVKHPAIVSNVVILAYYCNVIRYDCAQVQVHSEKMSYITNSSVVKTAIYKNLGKP